MGTSSAGRRRIKGANKNSGHNSANRVMEHPAVTSCSEGQQVYERKASLSHGRGAPMLKTKTLAQEWDEVTWQIIIILPSIIKQTFIMICLPFQRTCIGHRNTWQIAWRIPFCQIHFHTFILSDGLSGSEILLWHVNTLPGKGSINIPRYAHATIGRIFIARC
jgi:hypothetical protein